MWCDVMWCDVMWCCIKWTGMIYSSVAIRHCPIYISFRAKKRAHSWAWTYSYFSTYWENFSLLMPCDKIFQISKELKRDIAQAWYGLNILQRELRWYDRQNSGHIQCKVRCKLSCFDASRNFSMTRFPLNCDLQLRQQVSTNDYIGNCVCDSPIWTLLVFDV